MLETEIVEIARAVWEAMFAAELSVDAGDEPPAGESLTSVVHIEGAWQGAVTVHCPATLGSVLAARLFVDGPDPTDVDVRDLLGELANMLGGNIKALLPEPCSLSLPSVTAGRDYDVQVVDTSVAARVRFTCEGLPLIITLLERAR